MKTANDIREVFLQYFQDRGHRRVTSGPLVPQNDPTLLFTNAGMNQFKDVFLGLEKRDYRRAVSSQKCLRVSGKHNDLETVGRTARHHTFFEMLGNFSFGDYFKKEAIEFAWELCTQVFEIPPDRLVATVYQEDEEALALWRDHIGLPEAEIVRMGEKDNFWSMGNTGPCGPCSELHYDLELSPAGHEDCTVHCDCGRFVEIWNLVFMQFNRDTEGVRTPLLAPSIDTGMGLERITCVLQGVQSNYDTDLFRPIIEEAGQRTGTSYGQDPGKDTSLRILADHSRTCAFLINDGVIPGNEGRGYVLRKILRRAIRHGKMLGASDPFIYALTGLVAELMKEPYPELLETQGYCAKVVRNEEEKFSATLSQGTQRLEELCEANAQQGRLPGTELFRLYDTYGFPLDLAQEIASERGFQIDEEGFYSEMEKQRQRARASWKGTQKAIKPVYQELATGKLVTEFTGYEAIDQVSGKILALIREDVPVEELQKGQSGEMVLDRTPFYAESGGQVADNGTVTGQSGEAVVEDVFSPAAGLRIHRVMVQDGVLRRGEKAISSVAKAARDDTERNHTATHLLHAALREVLGEHVRQAGSLVAPDRLRFDFTHYQGVTAEEINRIEALVNRQIRANLPVQTEIRDLEEAVQEGAMALFGEKYQPRVRVVKVPGFSMELCGGTHVSATGRIALFKIVSESSISAGVRRMEAVTGEGAFGRFQEDESWLGQLSGALRVRREEVPPTVEKILQELKQAQKKAEDLQLKLAQQESAGVLDEVREIKGIKVLSKMVKDVDRGRLRQLADELKNRLQTGVVVLGADVDGKVGLIAMVSSDLTARISAQDLIRKVAPLVGGGGGGKADMAEAGGKDPSRLAAALEETFGFVEELIP